MISQIVSTRGSRGRYWIVTLTDSLYDLAMNCEICLN